MNEKYKAKLDKIKVHLKKNAPRYVVAATNGALAALAIYYRNEVVKMQTTDPKAWPVIEIPPAAMESVRQGATLKYREVKYGDNKYLAQSTTMDDFGEKANEELKWFKETGEFDVEAFEEPEVEGEFDLYRKKRNTPKK